MKYLKYTLLITLLCVGLSSLARADLTFLGTQDLANSGENTELAKFVELTGMSDAFICAKIELPATEDNGVSLVDNGNGTITVSFDFTGQDFVLCGFSVKDGSGTIANFYSVSAAEGVSGSFNLDVPGQGAISHLTVFCCPGGGNVPDSGATAMLLGTALSGLGVVRRYLKR